MAKPKPLSTIPLSDYNQPFGSHNRHKYHIIHTCIANFINPLFGDVDYGIGSNCRIDRGFAHYLTKCTPDIVIQMSLSYSQKSHIQIHPRPIHPHRKNATISPMLATTNPHVKSPRHPTGSPAPSHSSAAPPPAGFGNAIVPLGPRPSWGGQGGESLLELGALDGIPWIPWIPWIPRTSRCGMGNEFHQLLWMDIKLYK